MEVLEPGRRVLESDAEFDSVFGHAVPVVLHRQHHRFGGRGSRSQRFNGGSDVAAGEVESFAEIDGCRPVTYAEQEQMHWPGLA